MKKSTTKTKLLLLFAMVASSVSLFSQVGINTTTPDPSSILDIVSTNKGLLIPRVSLTGNTDVTTIPNPANGLLVYNLVDAGGANPVKKDNFYKFNTTANKWQLMLDEGNLPSTVMAPAVFRLDNNMTNFLNGVNAGSTVIIPMSMVTNKIPGLTYNTTNYTITFPAGIYKLEFVYEGDHNAAGCSISSYMVDFPEGTGTNRIHSTASHNIGGASNHGGVIAYTADIPAGKTWQITLGRGASGNCSGPNGTLSAKRTELLIFKMN